MTYTNRSMFTVPITSKACKLAKSFKSQYENPTKAEQVYLNTLAVYAVETYCECLGIETDLENSDSLNSVMQPLMNIADLEIEGIGKIECRPVLPEDEFCYIPVDTWENRIGYIVVEIDEPSREATLLGFYPPVNALEMMEEISLDSFLPLETFIDYLNRLESALVFFQSDDEVVETVKIRLAEQPITEIIAGLERIYRIHPKDKWRYAGGKFLASAAQEDIAWRGGNREDNFNNDEWQELAEELMNKLDEIWKDKVDILSETNVVNQPLPQPMINAQFNTLPVNFVHLNNWLDPNQESLNHWLSFEIFLKSLPENRSLRFVAAPRSRSAETEDRLESVSKVWQFQLLDYPLVLVMAYQVESEEKRTVIARLYPNGEDAYLPPDVKLIILEESGEVFLEATSRSVDNWIQLEFQGEPGERFSIKIELGEASITDNFMI
ncbi:hypothetical protein PCC9214_05558 [Planktothrix tepida]|uniref:DUF1822 family protein n=1 Tax=Planktothrix tepida PCC 9214 TaxID=671072 RepID=A0A1J1LV52_9CYAN|nr:DUF1822 family protein [Planktothrix tepida]CAD5989396.1 hypothetical protein PCC9214_05558 [Planktothrix tepida]CUR35481.1 hypothetical protein PL9214670107 [Planktothrix tepida PCC 9214]